MSLNISEVRMYICVFQSHGQMLSEGTQAICPVILEKTGLAGENVYLAAENAALTPENIALAAENVYLAAENAALAPANIALAAENAALAPENIALAAEITALTAEKAALVAEIAALTAENDAQTPENIALAAEITALTAEKDALTANNVAQVPEIAVLIVETTALTAEKVALVATNTELIGLNYFLEEQRDILNEYLAEYNGAAAAALEKQKIRLSKLINPPALNLCQATFELANMENTLETARAREEELEKELEDLKMTMKVEQEASFKQREDLINLIIEREEKLFIEQEEGKLSQQNTELQVRYIISF